MFTTSELSPGTGLGFWAFARMIAVAILLALPSALLAQPTVAQTPTASGPRTALLLSAISRPLPAGTHRSLAAMSSHRTRMVVAGGLVGAIAGGYLGYRYGKDQLCVQSPSYRCSPVRENTTKGIVSGAVLGAMTGFLISRL